ncbi:MAG: outer membrane protein assembly factor BamB family protein [Actinomycetota bacterium]
MKNRRPGLVVAFICALTLVACRQEAQVAAPVVSVSPSASVSPSPSPTPSPTARAAWPFDGRLLIADRGNNRLVLVDAQKHVLWAFPSRSMPAPPGGFYFPDDAFFTDHGSALIVNEEENHMIVRLSFPAGRVLWTYGHPGRAGSAAGYLNQPDDAYLLANGNVIVADASNCRVLTIDHRKRVVGQIGRAGYCAHNPPRALAYPNGDTPLANGNILISEVTGSYIDEVTPAGKVVWSVHLPIPYPSDPQQIGPNRYVVASYARPGGIVEFDRRGRILWQYRPRSGEAMLDHPSLAEVLQNGLICVNDDYRARVVIIDPKTQRIVWQYGHTDRPGRAPGYLFVPDGFDLLAPDNTTPTHPYTG